MINSRRIPCHIKPAARLIMVLASVCMMTMGSFGTTLDQETGLTVDTVGHSENYSAILYDNTNGMPTSEANDVVQTKEGFIWIGSYSGLIRYDGNEFERIDSVSSGITSVTTLFADSLDRLWIGTNDNGLVMMQRGEFLHWSMDDGLGSDKITAVREDENGTIYIGTTAGITVISPDLVLQPVDDPRIANAYINRLYIDNDGLICCLTKEGALFTLRDGVLEDYIDPDDDRIDGITCILPDPRYSGIFFMGTEASKIYHGDPRKGLDRIAYVDISPLTEANNLLQIRDQIWICARNGVGILDSHGFHYLADLPMNNTVTHAVADFDGNVWFTSSRQGVMKIVANRFTDVFKQNGLSEQVANTTCLYNGNLFIGTDTGLIVTGENGPLKTFPLTEAKTVSGKDLGSDDLLELLDGCRIRSIIRDSRDRLWISTWRACGLLRYEEGVVTAFDESDGLLSSHVRAVSETSDGAFLVACTGGVNVIEGDRVTVGYGIEDGIVNPESLTVCAAPNGDIVLGSNGGGIYVISGGSVRCIDTRNGLTSGIIMRIKYDDQRHIFWLVTSNSIAWMSEDYQVTTVTHFPYTNNFDLYENSKGDMWILSSNGIYVAPVEDLIADGEIRPVHYGLRNGMCCTPLSNSYSELTPEGDLYITGNTGVIKVNIESSLEEIDDLRQGVPFIEADGTMLYPDESGSFVIPASTKKLTIYCYVFNYSLTDPKLSYRLDGFDGEAVTVYRSELRPVTYTNLSGGSYHFVMELKDAMGRGGKTLSVPIVKEKALYEHLWFHILIALAAALAIAGTVWLYFRRKAIAMERKHKEEVEKERLNTELQTARQIQKSVLPHLFPPFPHRKEFDIYASMDPAKEVGGDFYDFFLVDEDHLCLVIADVSGKGIPASLFMMISKVILQNTAMFGKSVEETVSQTNEAICAHNQTEMFVTVWMGILEISTGKVTAVNAGHEYPALMQHGSFSLLKDRHGLLMGGMDTAKYREYEFVLEPGDKLFVYTDGVPEAADAEHNRFGTERMVMALNRDPKAAPEQILKNVRSAVDEFVQGEEQFDDLTMLCLEYKGTQDILP